MQERALKTRNRILNASRRLFAQYGYHGTSVDRIAKTAKANKERVYGYFSSKKKLFEECLKTVFEEVGVQEKELLERINGDLTDMTTVILRHYLDVHEQRPDFWRLIAWANLEPEPFYKCLKDIKAESYGRLRRLYAEGQEKKIFKRDVSFEVYMFTLFAVTYFYHSNRRTLSSTLDADLFTGGGAERVVRECARLFANGAI